MSRKDKSWMKDCNNVSKENMSFENQSEVRKKAQLCVINQEPGRVPKKGLYFIIYLYQDIVIHSSTLTNFEFKIQPL
jgi:hypothetical protein